jgi:hypothetical protein
MHMTFSTHGGYSCGTGFDSGTHDPHWITDPEYFVPGRRYVATMLIHWAYGGASPTGSIEIWINGREIGRFVNVATLNCGDVAYPNLENYRPSYQYAMSANPNNPSISVNGGAYPNTNVVYWGGLVKGSTWNDVQIPLGPGAPVNTTAPVLGGTASPGSALSVSEGTWAVNGQASSCGNSGMACAYQWQRCGTSPVSDNNGANVGGTAEVCTDIPGATGENYVVQSGDAGDVLQARVTATNGAGSSVAGTTSSATVS